MSLYNMVHGMNLATYIILPMLGKHPHEYPRFRDCYIVNENSEDDYPYINLDGKIAVYTRVGGGNRESYEEEIEMMQNMPTYVTDFDDDFDCTYATFVFDVPEEFKDDFELVYNGKPHETSDKYKEKVMSVFHGQSEEFLDKLNEVLYPTEKKKESNG